MLRRSIGGWFVWRRAEEATRCAVGDYVFADASGAAVISAGDVHAVLHTATRSSLRSVVTIRGESPNTLGDSEYRLVRSKNCSVIRGASTV